MSFKLNDYTAFLGSLFEKRMDDPMPSERQRKQKGFPTNFDFGLGMSQSHIPHNGKVSQLPMETNTQIFPSNPYAIEVGDIAHPSQVHQTGPEHDPFNVDYTSQCLEQEWLKNIEMAPFSKSLTNCTEMDDPKLADDIRSRPRTKSSHNVIEQRYRNKINVKFAALQESVPSIRVTKRKINDTIPSDSKKKGPQSPDLASDEVVHDFACDDDAETDKDDLEGLEPAKNINKGTILTKSIEYINFLRQKNTKLLIENQTLLRNAKTLNLRIDNSLAYDPNEN